MMEEKIDELYRYEIVLDFHKKMLKKEKTELNKKWREDLLKKTQHNINEIKAFINHLNEQKKISQNRKSN